MADQTTANHPEMKATSSKKDKFLGLLGIKKNGKKKPAKRPSDSDGGGGYDMPKTWAENLDEVAAPKPIENRDETAHTYTHHTLEGQRGG